MFSTSQKETVQSKKTPKLTEETPSPFVTEKMRKKMGEAAKKELKLLIMKVLEQLNS